MTFTDTDDLHEHGALRDPRSALLNNVTFTGLDVDFGILVRQRHRAVEHCDFH